MTTGGIWRGIARSTVRVFTRLRNPVFVDQAVYSAVNAGVLLSMGAFLPVGQLSRFVTLQAITVTVIGLQRALIGEPALAVRSVVVAASPFRVWHTSLLAAIAIGGAVMVIVSPPLWFIPLLGIPLLQDSLRYRSLMYGRASLNVGADLLWAGGCIAAVLIVRPRTTEDAVLVWTLPCLLASTAQLLVCNRKVRSNLRDVVRLGRFSFLDLAVNSVLALGPLLLAQWAFNLDSSVAAVRLSQTTFGPLGIVATTLAVSMLIRAPGLQRESPQSLRRRSANLARRYTLLSLLYSSAALVGVILLSRNYDDELRHQLLFLFPVVMIGTVIESTAAAPMATLRALGLTRYMLRTRIRVACASTIAIIVAFGGYPFTGVNPLAISIFGTSCASAVLWTLALRNSDLRSFDAPADGR